VCEDMPRSFELYSEQFLKIIMTDAEAWLYHYDPQSKQHSSSGSILNHHGKKSSIYKDMMEKR